MSQCLIDAERRCRTSYRPLLRLPWEVKSLAVKRPGTQPQKWGRWNVERMRFYFFTGSVVSPQPSFLNILRSTSLSITVA